MLWIRGANLKASADAESATEECTARALFNPSSKAPHIVAVPLVRLIVDRMPIRLDPKEPGSCGPARYGFAEHRQPYIVSNLALARMIHDGSSRNR